MGVEVMVGVAHIFLVVFGFGVLALLSRAIVGRGCLLRSVLLVCIFAAASLCLVRSHFVTHSHSYSHTFCCSGNVFVVRVSQEVSDDIDADSTGNKCVSASVSVSVSLSVSVSCELSAS